MELKRCNRGITERCFIKGCFDWLFAHSATCAGGNGQVTNYAISRGKDEHGKSVIRESSKQVEFRKFAIEE